MFSLIVDCERLPKELGIADEIQRFIAYVKSSRKAPGCDEILLPGEIEERHRQTCAEHGIDIDETTWQTLCTTAEELALDSAMVADVVR